MDPALYREILMYKTHQRYPDNANKGKKFVIRRRAEQYVIQDGELYYLKKRESEHQVCLKVVQGADEANRIFLECHSSGIGGHSGQHKTRDAISSQFYWPGMIVDIDNWVTKCPNCPGTKISCKQETFTPSLVKEPWELVSMDLVGEMTRTSSGNQLICVFTDYFSKWVMAFPIRQETAEEVASCVIKTVYIFGAPKRIVTDQGSAFVNQINKIVGEKLSTKQRLSSPHHPQKKGLVERMNDTIQRALHKLCQQKPETWDNYLDADVFGLRTKKLLTSRYSPYFLMFGQEARHPSEVPECYEVNRTTEDALQEEVIFPGIKLLYEISEKKSKAQKRAASSPESKDRTASPPQPVKRQAPPPQPLERPAPPPQPPEKPAPPTESVQRLTSPAQSVDRTKYTDRPVNLANYVEAAWSGKRSLALLFKIGPYKLYYWDIEHLAPDKEIESEVINAYVCALVRTNRDENRKAFLIESFTMIRIWQGSYQTLRKLNPNNYNVILGIINENHHWTLAVIYPSQRKTILLDPLGESDKKVKKCLKKTRLRVRTATASSTLNV